jgi:mRNA interferase MazF
VVNDRPTVARGEIWWAGLATPRGSEPGYRRPVLVVQSDAFNRSRIGTVIVVAITSNLAVADAPGNVRLARRDSGLPRTSVVDVSQVLTLDRRDLVERVGGVSARTMESVDAGLRLVLEVSTGRE